MRKDGLSVAIRHIFQQIQFNFFQKQKLHAHSLSYSSELGPTDEAVFRTEGFFQTAVPSQLERDLENGLRGGFPGQAQMNTGHGT